MPKSQRDFRFYTTLPLSHQSSGLTGTLRGSDFQAHTEVLLCLIDLFAVKLLRCDFHSLPCCVLQCVFTNAQVYTGMCKNKSLLICLLHLTGFFFFFSSGLHRNTVASAADWHAFPCLHLYFPPRFPFPHLLYICSPPPSLYKDSFKLATETFSIKT